MKLSWKEFGFWVVIGFVAGMVILNVSGCASQTIDATNRLMKDNLKPVIEKVMEDQKVKDMIIQANAQAINPAIVISGEGKYVQGIEWNIMIKADGTAANMQTTAVSDRATK